MNFHSSEVRNPVTDVCVHMNDRGFFWFVFLVFVFICLFDVGDRGCGRAETFSSERVASLTDHADLCNTPKANPQIYDYHLYWCGI